MPLTQAREAETASDIERKRLPPPGRSSRAVGLDDGQPSPPPLGVTESNGGAQIFNQRFSSSANSREELWERVEA